MPETKTRKRTSSSRRKTTAAKSSSSGGTGGNAVKHLAEALSTLADAVVFGSEVDKIKFQDHVIAATGGANKDQLNAAHERIKAREEAEKTA